MIILVFLIINWNPESDRLSMAEVGHGADGSGFLALNVSFGEALGQQAAESRQ
jgi:hypothetical protein